ncbi:MULTISPECIES: PLP-dependent aminotransferase family protein [unclassified Streptomyces]|uniref:aminotransferase-like domain-containing protein n=1 Tax=unclassified Streptomyces TaxID=2593676 RepID=UPI00344FDE8A
MSARELHPAVSDPALSAVGDLNEVMARHPTAISFAPGAPHPDFFADLDIPALLDRYVGHLARERGLDRAAARLLLYEYGPARGLINDLVAEALRTDLGITCGPDSVVITAGAQEAMLLTLRALCRSAEDVLAVVDPAYVGITGAARFLDIPVVPVEDMGAGPDLGRLEQVCADERRRGRRVRALYVAPDFANPSGTRMDLPSRRRLLETAAREGFLVIEDSAYGFTAAGGDVLPPLKALDQDESVIHLGTFSKVCLPGTRVGYVLADQRTRGPEGSRPLAHHLAALKGAVTVNTSPLCQAVIGGMLLEHGGSLAPFTARRSAFYRGNLRALLAALERHVGPAGRFDTREASAEPPGPVWQRPAGGFFVRMRLPVPVDTALLELSAARYGVLWTPMSPFWIGGGGDNELRLSCSYLTPERIREGATRLARFLAGLPAPGGATPRVTP